MRNFLFEIDGEPIIMMADNEQEAKNKLHKYFNVYDYTIIYCGEITEFEADFLGFDTYD